MGGLLVLAALLPWLEGSLRSAMGRLVLPTDGAAWIWAPGLAGSGPTAFTVAREFTLDSEPASARLISLADEEYRVLLNGEIVGSNRYAAGAPLDVYEVGPLLRRGRNRLVAELRSTRGIGGFLALLEGRGTAGERIRVATGGDWKVFWRSRRDLFTGEGSLEGGARVAVWGIPPAGRWGAPWRLKQRLLFRELVEGETADAPRAVRVWREGRGWVKVRGGRLRRPLGPRVAFDWGREVTGYVGFRLEEGSPAPALVFLGSSHPSGLERGRPAAVLTLQEGGRSWFDVRPQRFRYAVVLGAPGLLGASVRLTDPGKSAPLLAPRSQRRGVFGLAPPRPLAPLEEEIRDGLEEPAG